MSEHLRISPVARRLAEARGVDIGSVKGTGPHGRILKADIESVQSSSHARTTFPSLDASGLPSPAEAREWLRTMMVIRKFEERAGESYAKAKVGGFLHLAIGEEAAILGTARAMLPTDYLIGTYRTHGHAIARGSDPRQVLAELFGRETGTSKGRGGSMHIYDAEKRFVGGYGIVGGNIPIGAGFALASKLRGDGDVVVCTFGDGASNNGTFGETLNMAALWNLPIVFVIENNLFGMGTSLERHTAQTDLSKKGLGYGVQGVKCDGMNPSDTYLTMREAIEKARGEGPNLVEIITYRFRGHSMADPEEYRTKQEVSGWMEKDPIRTFSARMIQAGMITENDVQGLDHETQQIIDHATEYADQSPHPRVEELTRDTYAETDNTRNALFSGDGMGEQL